MDGAKAQQHFSLASTIIFALVEQSVNFNPPITWLVFLFTHTANFHALLIEITVGLVEEEEEVKREGNALDAFQPTHTARSVSFMPP